MAIQVGIWAGDLHHTHVGEFSFSSWADASAFIQEQVDNGMLCNVLHTDFKVPESRLDEMNRALLAASEALKK
jgi:hypothetical protein